MVLFTFAIFVFVVGMVPRSLEKEKWNITLSEGKVTKSLELMLLVGYQEI